MYYTNRSTFYIRHFGSKLLIISIIAVVFLFGTYSYISAANITPKTMLTAVQAQVEEKGQEIASLDDKKSDTSSTQEAKEEKTKQEVVKQENTTKKEEVKKEEPKKDNSLFVKKENKLKHTRYSKVALKDLKSYKLSGGVKVVEVLDTNKIVVEDIDSTKYTVNLIGVTGLDETKYTREGVINTVNSLNQMLNSKLVQLEFDIEKENQGGTLNAYVYYNKALLNADILANGYCDIKVENSNTNRIGDLLIALKAAKTKQIGIWKNTNN